MAQAWINHQQLPDDALPVIADTIRLQTSQTELAKLDTLGVLAKTIFGKIASQENEIKGLFSNQSLSELSLSLDRKINPEEVQSAISTLLDEDLIMRMGHGTYDITDPFIREVWNDASIPFNPNPEIELDPFVDLIADQKPKLKKLSQ